MRIAAAASAFPKYYYPQEVLLGALRQFWGDKLQDVRVLDRLHEHVGVEGRHLALPLESYLNLNTWGKANDAWIEAAEQTGQRAICQVLNQAGLAPQELGALFFISITGIASPSIDARLINRMGLSPKIRRTPIFGLGCVGGAAGIARAADYVRAYPDQTAVVLAVEFCSLTFQRNDVSVANLISSGLFGDGAAAVIVSGDDVDRPGPEILSTRSIFYPDTEQVMGWNISEEGFRVVLSREVPGMVRKHLGPDVDEFLKDNGLHRGDIGSWIMHTGGPAVLQATEQVFDLQNGELNVSWECLRKTGNLSSASVLVVLEEVMSRRKPQPGTFGILAAMGPGFCSELILLRW
jgi:alkylresorcinol/alkylpyrone synthase